MLDIRCEIYNRRVTASDQPMVDMVAIPVAMATDQVFYFIVKKCNFLCILPYNSITISQYVHPKYLQNCSTSSPE